MTLASITQAERLVFCSMVRGLGLKMNGSSLYSRFNDVVDVGVAEDEEDWTETLVLLVFVGPSTLNSRLSSERGWRLQEMLNDLYQPKGARATVYFLERSCCASFRSDSAIAGEERWELK